MQNSHLMKRTSFSYQFLINSEKKLESERKKEKKEKKREKLEKRTKKQIILIFRTKNVLLHNGEPTI